MNSSRKVTLFHSPNTRSTGTLLLLEELGADYEIHLVNMKAGEQSLPAYLSINPMGKVPAIKHGEVVVTEQVAIFLYLTDLYSEAGLAPTLTDPLRGSYLRWMLFYAGCFEPALVDLAQKREPSPASMSPYGDFETMFKTLTNHLEQGPYILGEKFSGADILWGTALNWMTKFQLLPSVPVIQAYVDRANARPVVAKVREKDEAFVAQLAS